MLKGIRAWGQEGLGKFARAIFALTLAIALMPVTPLIAAATPADEGSAPEVEQTSGSASAEDGSTEEVVESDGSTTIKEEAPESTEASPAPVVVESVEPAGEVVTLDANADVWDGSIDTSWYNTTDTVFTLTKPAQLAGLAAITSPKSYDDWATGAKESRAAGITVDSFEGKTIKLGADIDLNGFKGDGSDNMRWDPISDMNNWGGGGQGVSGGTHEGLCWKGTFDGCGYTVKNMRVDGAVNCSNNFGGYQGFISAVGDGAIVQNLGVTGKMYGRVCGGIVAGSNYAKDYSDVPTQAVDLPRVQNCWTNVTITGNGSGSRCSGGIYGGEDDSRVSCNVVNCYVLGSTQNSGSAGGVTGAINGVVAGCYNVGAVSGSFQASVSSCVFLPSSSSETAVSVGMYTNNMALAGTNANVWRYRDETTARGGTPVAVTDGFSTADELKAGATTLGSGYVADTGNINSGYPVLFWQAGLSQIDISGATVAAIEPEPYTGKPITPELTVTKDSVTLVDGVDYLVKYEDNIEAGENTAKATVYGIGRYTGQLAAVNFSITQLDLSDCTIDPIPNQWFYGEPLTPKLVVKDADENVLTEGKDYAVSYTNNAAAGKATATISAAGSASKSADFYITAASSSLAGEGTEASPYLIGSKADLQFAAHMVNEAAEGYPTAFYKVTADIDATQANEHEALLDKIGVYYFVKNDEGTYEYTRNYFQGSFDGDGHTITLDMKTSANNANSNTALFGYVGEYNGKGAIPVTIKNLTIDGTVTGYGAAAFVGSCAGASLTIENCTNKADVTGTRMSGTNIVGADAAGFVCSMSLGKISNCTNEGTILGANAAGIVYSQNSTGLNNAAETIVTIEKCVNKGSVGTTTVPGMAVTSTTTSPAKAAGIIANSQMYSPVVIFQCANVGEVGCKTAGQVGGLIGTCAVYGGKSPLTVESCYNSGSVTGKQNVGGIINSLPNYAEVNVLNCYNTGTLTNHSTNTANRTGGIVAIDSSASYNVGDRTITGYNAGTINSEKATAGAILGYANLGNKTYPTTLNVAGGFLEGTASEAIAAKGTSAYMTINDDSVSYTESELKAVPANLGFAFFEDTDPAINNGFPVLYWQTGLEGLDIATSDIDPIPDQDFVGAPVTPDVTVVYKGETLTEGIDYTVNYTNNIGVGTATADIVGAGIFNGSHKEVSFNIVGVDLSSGSIADIPDTWAGGSSIPATPAIVVKDASGLVLTEGVDYTAKYTNNTSTGTANVIVTGIGNYKGSMSKTFEVVSTSVDSLSGSGTTTDPYLIGNKDELEFFALGVNENYSGYPYAAFKVTADIDATDMDGRMPVDTVGSYIPSGTLLPGSWTAFQGLFDGDGHTITLGLDASTDYTAMFGVVDNASISNVTTIGGVSGTADNAAGLVGMARGNITIRNCTNMADIDAASAAGLVSRCASPKDMVFEDCENLGTVTGTSGVSAGLVGYVGFSAQSNSGALADEMGSLSFTRCFNNGDVVINGSNASIAAAGLLGATSFLASKSEGMENVSFAQCGNTGNIETCGYAGGLLGTARANFTNYTLVDVYNTGTVQTSMATTTASDHRGAGGLIAYTFDNYGSSPVTITNAYNAGTISGLPSGVSGGLIGAQEASNTIDVSNSYWGEDTAGESIGFLRSGASVTDDSAKATDNELKTTGADGMAAKLGSSFFDDVTGTNNGYPVLDSATISIQDCFIAAIPRQTYTGKAITPSVRVVDAMGVTLVEGTDYDLAISNNTAVGLANVMVIGTGNYTGIKTTTFEITKANLGSCTLAPIDDQVATGEPLTPTVEIVNAAGVELVDGVDYNAFYFNNTALGKARVSVIGTGNYSGQLATTFNIVAADLSNAEISGVEDSYDYTGETISIDPVVVIDDTTLDEGTDYTVTITDADDNPVTDVKEKGDYTLTITGTGVYTGTVVKDFTVGTYFTVYTQVGPTGEPEVVKEYSKSEFEALKASTAPAVSMLYYKGSEWNVLSSDSYVTVPSILADAGIADQFVEGTTLSIGEFGGFTAQGTWDEYEAQVNFYPGLKADSSGLDDPRNETAVLALSYGKSTINGDNTAGDVETSNLANQDTSGAPRLLRGVSEEQVTSDKKAAGNRSPSGCNSITLITPEPVYFTLYTQAGKDGTPQVAKTYTESELNALQSSSTDPVSGMFYKGNNWSVTTAITYVTLEDLFADAGVSDLWNEEASISYGGDPLQGKAGQVFGYDEFNSMNTFYPEAQMTTTPTAGATPAPAVLSLTEYSCATSPTMSAGDAQDYNIANPNINNKPRLVYGISEEAYLAQDAVPGKGNVAGMRYWSRNESLTIITPAEKNVTRLSGNSALDTMDEIVGSGFADNTCHSVIVATIDGYYDALTASGLAGLEQCPVLLTNKDNLPAQTSSEIERLASTGSIDVYIVGGNASVNQTVEDSIKDISCVESVTRISGANAVGTANEIYKAGTGWGDTAIVTTSLGFQDALSISPYSYSKNAPVFLTDGSTLKLTDETLSLIKEGGFSKVVIVGGPAGISTQVEVQLDGAGINSERLYGQNAYDTSNEVAKWCLTNGLSADTVCVATGESYYDALCGASMCGKNGGIMVLVSPNNLTTVNGFMTDNKDSLNSVYLFGGKATVPESTESAIKALLEI